VTPPRLAQMLALGAGCVLSQACSLALDFDATHAESSATGRGFCRDHVSPPAVFCDDFDGLPLGRNWAAIEEHNGRAQIDGGAAFSAPNSLLSIADPAAAGATVRALGATGFPKLASTRVGLRISFALRVDEFDAANGANNVVFDLVYGPPGDINEIELNLVSTETAVSLQMSEVAQTDGEDDSQYAQHGPFVTKPPLGEWTKVEIDVDINNVIGLGNTLRVAIDDHQELDTSLSLPLKGDTPRVELGVGWVDTSRPTQTWAVRFDDFLVEAVTLK